MTQERIQEIISKIKNVRVAVYGDFCLDGYWIMDKARSEISVETGLKAETVSRQTYSPGGAGNVVANLAALNNSTIKAIGIIGDDMHGKELTRLINDLEAETSGLIVQNEMFETYTYLKKYYRGKEEPRIDFGLFNKRSKETDAELIKHIRIALENYDAFIFNQQIAGCITNELFLDQCNKLFDDYSDKIIIVDTRDYGDKLHNVFRKSNEIELAALNGVDAKPTDSISIHTVKEYGQQLYSRYKKPIFITLGDRGIVSFDKDGITEVPGVLLTSQLDIVGAGDTFLSALTLCLAAGVSSTESAIFANLASAVTVQKLQTTGTATGEEILALSSTAKYNYNPD